MSHPVRVRGLKLAACQICQSRSMSHPVRVRGLKPAGVIGNSLDVVVAPRAGAWVETTNTGVAGALVSVAPRAGAWVET